MGPSPLLEAVCLAIVGLYVALRAPCEPSPRAFLLRLGALVVAAWVAEDTSIRAYGFYFYDPRWSVFVDRVPLLIVLIWPVVIHSAWDLARRLCRAPARVPLVAAALVLADASLIEPIAVRAGLWRWTEPGLFTVPPIGIVGWAIFTWLALHVLATSAASGRDRARAFLALLPVTALGTHAGLLALWWGALRWANGAVAPWPAVALVWGLAAGLAVLALRRGAGRGLPARDLLLRLPGAAFFFALLVRHADGEGTAPLVAYALAFAPPYLVLTAQSLARGRA